MKLSFKTRVRILPRVFGSPWSAIASPSPGGEGEPSSKLKTQNSKFYQRGFTLVEMIVALTVFTLVVFGTVAVQIYSMRVYSLASIKLNATQQARAAMNDVRDQVRESREVSVGNYTQSSGNPLSDFTAVTNGSAQEGNALMIYPTTGISNFTLVYLQPGNATGFSVTSSSGSIINTNSLILLVYTNGQMMASNEIAGFITNQIVFDAENFEGTILSNNENNAAIHMTLDFSQWAFPLGFDYYQLNTLMTRRDGD